MNDDNAFAAGVAFVLEELGERQTGLGFDDVGEQLAAEPLLLRRALVGQVQQHGIEHGAIDAGGVPTGIEVSGLIFRCDEAPVQPDLSATGYSEQLNRLRVAVEQPSTTFGPSESFEDLVPRCDMLARWQSATVGVERRKQTTTLSLW